MKNLNAPERRRGRLAAATVVALAMTAALPRATAPGDVAVPPVPANIQAPEGAIAFLIAHASGTQNYVCLPSGSKFAWTFFGPQATLFDAINDQLMTHFLSPNPTEGGTPRATWQDSRDTSAVWAAAIESSTDPAFVASGAIPWLLLKVMGTEYGPRAGDNDRMVGTTYIQRVNTSGGVAPAAGCKHATDVGKKALVPYTTDYIFYR